MDIESLRLALHEPSLLGLGLSFVAGFIFSFNPVVIAAIPVALAYVTKAHAPRQTLRNEPQLLLNLCRADSAGCPIVSGIEHKSSISSHKKSSRRPPRS